MKETSALMNSSRRQMAFCGPFYPRTSGLQSLHFAKSCRRRPTLKQARKGTRYVQCSASLVNMAPTFLMANVGQAVTLNSIFFVVAKLLKQHVLTNAGLLHAFVLGVLLWSCLSWQGYSLCFSFLIFGSLVTKIGKAEKERLGIAEKREGARGPENLWGAAGTAAICAICALLCKLLDQGGMGALYETVYRVLLVGYTASLATKMSDTTATEIGKAYGSVTYLVTSLRVVAKGTEGAVSVEGTAAGAMASLISALYALAIGLLSDWTDVGIVVVAAFVATTAESVIGATVQEDYQWSNEFVNFINTAIGAVVAMGLKSCFLSF